MWMWVNVNVLCVEIQVYELFDEWEHVYMQVNMYVIICNNDNLYGYINVWVHMYNCNECVWYVS